MDPTLLKYIQRLAATSYYPVTFSGDIPNIINRWLVKSELAAEAKFEYLGPYLTVDGRLLNPRETASGEVEYLEKNWRFYISNNQGTFYQACTPQELFCKDRDKYIYALSSIYCRQDQRVVIYANSITPVRLWINGQLVLTNSFHYHIKPYLFIYNFTKGINTILLEKPLFLKDLALGINPDHFMIIIKPVRFLLDQEMNGLLDPEILEDLEQSFTVMPETAFIPAGKALKFIVLPKVLPERKPEEVKVRISECTGKTIDTLVVKTGAVASVTIQQDFCGVLHLEAVSTGRPERFGDVYLCYGNILEKCDQLIAAARKRNDCNEALIDTLLAVTEIADMDTGCIRKFPQTVQDRLYYPVFKTIQEFEAYLGMPDGPTPKTHFEIFRKQAFFIKKSDIDDGYIIYSIHLPLDYDRSRQYPLLISVQYGYGMSVYPLTQRYVQKQHFREVVVMNICGLGHFNRDYINETELFHLFDHVIRHMNIDRDRVYIIGSCTGTVKALGMALRRPDLFAAVAGINGVIRLDPEDPDYEYIQNLSNTMVYQLFNIEDHLFNGARVADILGRLPKVKWWSFTNYSHDDFDEFLNQGKLMRELLREKRVKYPKRIEYTVLEPVYNRAFWVQVDFMQNLTEKAVIITEIKSTRFIEVRTVNIGCFTLWLDNEAMALEREIAIRVNHRQQMIQLTGYSQVKVTISKETDDYTVQTTALPPESFKRKYDEIRIPEELMGLKAIYLHKCRIIKPDYFKSYRFEFAKKLFYALQSPLKERVRNYKYELYWESELNLEDFSGSNWIYAADIRQETPFQRQLLELLGLKAEVSRLDYGRQIYEADYFALLKYPNPWNPDWQVLILVFNNDALEQELLWFLNSMDSNGYFYSDAVIYHQGKYYSFRNPLPNR